MLNNTCSVTNPLPQARNSTMYYYRAISYLPSLKSFPWQTSIQDELLSPMQRSILQVSVLYMARIGEILSLKVKHVCHPDRVVCYGSKRGNGYMLYLPGLSAQLEEWVDRDQETKLFPATYMQVYRACVKAGILINDGQGKNSMKCHSHRYLFACKEKIALGSQGIKIALHHKSIESQLPYVNKTFEEGPACSEQTELDFGERLQKGVYKVKPLTKGKVA